MRKTRPCLVISPDELNQSLRTVIVAPMTTKGRSYPWRASVTFSGKSGRIALDQLRTVDRECLIRRLGSLDTHLATQVLDVLTEMFAA
jgi:mRNA interferase MazF